MSCWMIHVNSGMRSILLYMVLLWIMRRELRFAEDTHVHVYTHSHTAQPVWGQKKESGTYKTYDRHEKKEKALTYRNTLCTVLWAIGRPVKKLLRAAGALLPCWVYTVSGCRNRVLLNCSPFLLLNRSQYCCFCPFNCFSCEMGANLYKSYSIILTRNCLSSL